MKLPKVQPSKHNIGHLILSHEEAAAGSPQDTPIAGEEDPGAALEDFVEFTHDKLTMQIKPRKS